MIQIFANASNIPIGYNMSTIAIFNSSSLETFIRAKYAGTSIFRAFLETGKCLTGQRAANIINLQVAATACSKFGGSPPVHPLHFF